MDERLKPLTALVTGANRGIGLEIARQLAAGGYRVLASARDGSKAASAAAAISGDVSPVALDVDQTDKIASTIALFERQHGAIDVLVNNAAILIDGPGGFSASLFDMTDETMRKTWTTNVLGPAALIRAILPGMIARDYGRIVNMSSLAGQLSEMGAGFPAYRMSKAGLNALTRIAAAEASRADVKINAASPGWVQTEMGGAQATRTVAAGAETPVWLARLGPDGPTGGFFHDKTLIPW